MRSFLYGFAIFLVTWPILGVLLATLFADDNVMERLNQEERRQFSAGIMGIAFMLSLGLAILLGITFSRHS